MDQITDFVAAHKRLTSAQKNALLSFVLHSGAGFGTYTIACVYYRYHGYCVRYTSKATNKSYLLISVNMTDWY